MNTRSLLLLVTAPCALAAPLLVTVATHAGDADPRADADAGLEARDGGADSEPDVDAGADAAPTLPSYQAEPFPEERSPEPRPREWTSAPKVAIDRMGPAVSGCEARRVREWVRIHCEVITGAISLLGGDREGLAMRLDFKRREEWQTFPERADIIFPVRRGDRREIEWLGVSFGYHGMTSVEPAFVVSEQWAPGDERPMIVAE